MNIRKIVIKLENGIDQQKVREYLKFAQQQMGMSMCACIITPLRFSIPGVAGLRITMLLF